MSTTPLPNLPKEKKFCTGPRTEIEAYTLLSLPDWHGLYGHANAYTPDHKSRITGYGKHDRVITFEPQFCEEVGELAIYLRIDHIWKLGKPTLPQILNVIQKDTFAGGRNWKITKVDEGEKSTDMWLTKKYPLRITKKKE